MLLLDHEGFVDKQGVIFPCNTQTEYKCPWDITKQALDQCIKNASKLRYYYEIQHIFAKNYVSMLYTIPHVSVCCIH